MSEYRVYFSAVFAPKWYKKEIYGKKQEIPPYGAAVSSNDIFTMYSKDIDRLFEGMKTFGGSVELTRESVIRYEYWVTEDNANQAWSLNKPQNMKYAGVTKWWEGNHRIVICREQVPRPEHRSRILLRPVMRIQGTYPGIFRIADLVDEIRQFAQPEKGEGWGDAAELAIVDGLATIASFFT